MIKKGHWNMDLYIYIDGDGKRINLDDLTEEAQDQIMDAINMGETNGEFTEECE